MDLGLSAKRIIISDNKLNTKNPVVMGIRVLLYICPIAVPIHIEIMEETEPMMAAAIPATCPIGSIAMAFRLPKIKPKQKNNTVAKIKNIHSDMGVIACSTKNIVDVITITNTL